MNFKELISELGLEAKYQSRQYELSKIFIEQKLALKVPQTTMALLMEVSFDKYLEMEKGSIEIPENVYEEALKKLKSKQGSNFDTSISKDLVKYSEFVFKSKDFNEILEGSPLNDTDTSNLSIEIKDIQTFQYNKEHLALESNEQASMNLMKYGYDISEDIHVAKVTESPSNNYKELFTENKFKGIKLNVVVKISNEKSVDNALWLEEAV